MSRSLNIKVAPKLKPLLYPMRYKGAWGGRGGAKSWFFAGLAISTLIIDPNKSVACVREVQSSMRMSVKRLLEGMIRKYGVEDDFIIQEAQIKCKRGRGIITFHGLQNHTADQLKSLEDVDVCWCEEAQSLSQSSLDVLRPTIRKENSEIWFSWNPKHETDAIDRFLRPQDIKDMFPDSTVVKINCTDNPWFPKNLIAEMKYDKIRDYDKYLHVWEGEYEKNSEARVFKNWRVEEFEAPEDAMLRFGADWGFSIDPTVLIRGFIKERTLYIDYEAYQVGCEILDTPALFETVPQSAKWPLIADSARPEVISHMRKHGFPKIQKATKGKNSIMDGIEFLKTFDIVIHPRCTHTRDEIGAFSYKIDAKTNEVTNILQKTKNHVIDAARYMCEGARKAVIQPEEVDVTPLPMANCW